MKSKTYQITLPKILATEVEGFLAQRQISLSDYVAVALRGMPKEATLLNLTTAMPFGKYRGELVSNITRADPAYILWMAENVAKVRMATEVIDLAGELINIEGSIQ